MILKNSINKKQEEDRYMREMKLEDLSSGKSIQNNKMKGRKKKMNYYMRKKKKLRNNQKKFENLKKNGRNI